jgi:dUTP pyrophosphatase
MILEFFRIKDNALIPQRANPSDAGLDVFACLEENVLVEPNESKLIPIGIKIGVPHGHMLQVMNRSSVAAKRSLIVGAHVIDSGYNGEIFVNLHNIGSVRQSISHGDKIAQIVTIPVMPVRLFESLDDNLYEEPIMISNRGDGALGSTNDRK